jgi:excisionase family DNA binding protein
VLGKGGRPYVGMTQSTSPVILVSQLEAARLLGVDRTTIWRMCSRGNLDRVPIGRRALITTASIDAYVTSRCVATPA